MQSRSSHTKDARLPKFARFAFLPAEIRNMIWEFACMKPPRVHVLALPRVPGRSPITFPRDDIGDLDKHNPAHRHRMTVMLENYRRRPKSSWSIPGSIRYKTALKPSVAIRLACPESKAVFDRVASSSGGRVELKSGSRAPACLQNDIFCFRSHHKSRPLGSHMADTTGLFLVRPQIRPAQIAIEILYDDESHSKSNFRITDYGILEQCLPRWFAKSIEWAHDAKEESSTGPQVLVKPPQESLAIDLQDVHTIFILSYGIMLLSPLPNGNAKTLPTNFNNGLVAGLESHFYILDPDSAVILQHWDIPPYVWAARREVEGLFNASESWKVNVKFMVAIERRGFTKHQSSLVKVPTVDDEQETFAGAR